MGVSQNWGTPKWMVYNGKPYQKMDDLGGNPPYFLEPPICLGILASLAFKNQGIHLGCRFLSQDAQFEVRRNLLRIPDPKLLKM